jgi:hypothetical protein
MGGSDFRMSVFHSLVTHSLTFLSLRGAGRQAHPLPRRERREERGERQKAGRLPSTDIWRQPQFYE